MNSRVQVTWDDGSTVIYTDIPAKDYDRLGEARVIEVLEQKFKKKVVKIKRLDSPTQSGRTDPSSRDDRDSSSQQQLPVDKKPTPNTTTAHHRDEEPDYRDKFPDKYTPKNMRRNKWGELIYE